MPDPTEQLDLHDNTDEFGQAIIDQIVDPELKAAVKVIWAARCSKRWDHNSVDWGIEGTRLMAGQASVEDACFTIGIVRW